MSRNKFGIKLPTGSTLNLNALDDQTIEFIKSQCPDQEILRLESIGGPSEVYHFHASATTSWFGLGKSQKIQKFENSRGELPPPGTYRLILSENKDEVNEYGICGSAVEVMKQGKTFSQRFGTACTFSLKTQANSSFSYGITVVHNVFIVVLHFDAHFERFLDVKPPADLNRGGQNLGLVSGNVQSLASVIPFESLLDLLSKPQLKHIENIIFTGQGWSGTIAHCAAILFRKILEECGVTQGVKAVSFNGPLCGSMSLIQYINSSDNMANHTTIGDGSIVDRIILDVQKLSPLMKEPDTFRKQFYVAINLAMQQMLKDDIRNIEDSMITNAEQTMLHQVTLSQDNNFKPVGRYVYKCGSSSSTATEADEFQQKVQGLSQKQLSQQLPFTFNDVHTEAPRTQIAGLALRPSLTSFKAQWTKYRVTLSFQGENLDCIKGRLLEKEIIVGSTSQDDLPFWFSKGGLKANPDSKITTIIPSSKKVTIEISNADLEPVGEVKLSTDFGDTNSITYHAQDIVRGEESAPSKSLHPTMNAEFLSAAVLRVAIYCKRLGGLDALGSNAELLMLWTLLLDLEKELCGTTVLPNYVSQYLSGEDDITTMRNKCVSVLATMAMMTVEDFQFRENIFAWGGRKLAGLIGKVAGGLMVAAGVILALPASILMTPVIIATGGEAPTGTASQVGFYAATGAAAILSIPSFIVGAMGLFVYSAANYAMQDRESLKYKTILRSLLQAIGEDAENVVDELCPLEDRLVETLTKLLPGVALHTASKADIDDAIGIQVGKESPGAKSLQEEMQKLPVLKQKLYLVCRINRIRQILEDNLLIGFVGVHNAGKSTTINRLFGADTGADLVIRTEEPTGYLLGKWMDQAKKDNVAFRDWYAKQNCTMQLYAVDFPGTTDERQAVGLITHYTAELASMFVVVLKAGHIAKAEKDIVQVAKNNHKPVIVVINHCDTIRHELNSVAGYERIKASYAKTLEVPETSLFFMSALDSKSIARLRGTLFSMVHNLLGNPKRANVLPLHFLTDSTVEELQRNNILNNPQDLCDVVSSVLFNSKPLTAKYVIEMMQVHAERKRKHAEERNNAAHHASVHPMRQQILTIFRRLACQLRVSEEVYSVATELFLANCETIEAQIQRDQFIKDAINERDSNDNTSVLETLIALVSLGQLNDCLNAYFDPTKKGTALAPSEAAKERVSKEVFLGVNNIFEVGISRGYKPRHIQLALRQICITTNCSNFSDADLLEVIQEVSARDDIVTADMIHLALGTESANNDRRSFDSGGGHSIDATIQEFEKYRTAKHHLDNLSKLCFPTLTKVAHNNRGKGMISGFKEKLNQYAARLTNKQMITVVKDSDGHITNSVLEGLMAMNRETLNHCDVRFHIEGDEALDANGVTKSILTKIAGEINDNPSMLGLRKHDDNPYLYFDTATCYCKDASLLDVHRRSYRALGRLIGLTLKKAGNGATLPINFPMAFYKWLLGYSLSLADLESIAPTIARSIQDMCLMEDTAFDSLELTMTANLSNGKVYEFCPGGALHDVRSEHRLDFLRALVQFHLCCDGTEDTLSVIALGVQDVCQRELFNELPPVSLQMIIEGVREIDVDEWEVGTDVKLSGRGGQITQELFWTVLREMSNEERSQLLCFATGSAALPTGGFQALNPLFTLVIGIKSADSLPESHTCFNMLVLPPYNDKQTMKEKLAMACSMTQVDQFGQR